MYQLQDQCVTLSHCVTLTIYIGYQGARMLRSHTSHNTTVFTSSQAQAKLTTTTTTHNHKTEGLAVSVWMCDPVLHSAIGSVTNVPSRLEGENVTDRTGFLTPLRPLTNPT